MQTVKYTDLQRRNTKLQYDNMSEAREKVQKESVDPAPESLSDAEKSEINEREEREKRCVALAVDIIKFTAETESIEENLGSVKDVEKSLRFWQERAAFLTPMLRNKDLTTADIGHAFKLAQEGILLLSSVIDTLIEEKDSYVYSKFLGIANIHKLPFDTLEQHELSFRKQDYENSQNSVEKQDEAIDTEEK